MVPYRSFGDTIPVPTVARVHFLSPKLWYTLALCGLEEPFFQLCCCVMSVFGSGGKEVLVYILMYLEYNTVVVLC